MQISHIFLSVLATAASVHSADSTASATSTDYATSTTTLTKSLTLTKVSSSSSATPTSVATNTTTQDLVPTTGAALPVVAVVAPTTSTYFPQPNTTSSNFPQGTGVHRSNSTLIATSKVTSTAGDSSSTSTSTSSGSASASSGLSSSAGAVGVQAMQGGLLLSALGAIAMMI
ncbi:hypothetical protein SLS53_002874 [Cytospora paraplurivora]|uniref:Uncharacterized protein n=1 Tax=Cytospora paraplurivora TaxID=2898453 RepID=A0AAN9UCY2_9PEZI